MNTFLKSLALILTAAVPVAFSVESLGLSLPTPVNTAHLFGAFVVVLTLLTLLADYGARKPLTVLSRCCALPRAALRLAA